MKYDVYVRNSDNQIVNYAKDVEPGIAAMEALDGMTLYAGSTVTLTPVDQGPGTRGIEPGNPKILEPST